MPKLTDYVHFNDEKLAKKYRNTEIPMSVLYESYFDGELDIKGDVFAMLRERQGLVKYNITRQHLQWAMTNFVPDVVNHSRAQDERAVRERYDRSVDFFEFFLGPSMVATSGRFGSADESLEEAQRNQMLRVTGKLQLEANHKLLDIGCGWGGLLAHCVRDSLTQQRPMEAVGITLSKKQAEYANRYLERENLNRAARVELQDYRDLSSQTKFDRVVCLELIEHVGFKNVNQFAERVYEVLADDGLFLLQWTGLRRSVKPEDMIWGLFMNKYIYPGADAALPPSTMMKAFEKVGFEVHSIENISGHYAQTLRLWRDNWLANREAVVATHGERWFRIWNFFLAWSILIASEGNAGCYQAVLHKNLDTFNRQRWFGETANVKSEGSGEPKASAALGNVTPIKRAQR
jgi:cyclopropane fatty-acyl-phospholipid synthase-like methyltransferase